MRNDEKRVHDLEAEISALPAGYISKKAINGKVKKYYQWTENGKKKSKYLNDELAAEMELSIIKRRELQKELKKIKATLPKLVKEKHVHEFKTMVLTGDSLRVYAEQIKALKRRSCYRMLEDYLNGNYSGKVFILYGLRRTGKTTLIRQSILALSQMDFNRTAFIQVCQGNTLGDINTDLKWLASNQFKNIFIDEVTFAEDFIHGAALLSDIYAASGMKVILSGTDSLGFMFSESEELYDRCVMLHTTFIPFREFERVLGIKDIDEYIRYGGTMSLGGMHYNEMITFRSKKSTDEYINSSIARNIQHSLRYYHDEGHFRDLAELYEKNELTSAINRVVEDINHRFTIEVLAENFVSHDLGISRRNLRKDRSNPTDIFDRIDVETVTEGLRNKLEILNLNEQCIQLSEVHRKEIKEYLDLLDLTVDIPVLSIPVEDKKQFRTAIAQPGMRYAQAEALVKELLQDETFQGISAEERNSVLTRIMNEIKGRMMEDIILLETKTACPEKEVFRLQFAIGEFDMVVADPNTITCEIYEIKHRSIAIPEQYKNLIDEKKCKDTAFRFGKITRKAVIYRGENLTDGEIEYLNAEHYLKNLGQ